MEDEKRLASNAIGLLDQCQLKGQDVPVFVEVRNWLYAMVDGREKPPQLDEQEKKPN